MLSMRALPEGIQRKTQYTIECGRRERWLKIHDSRGRKNVFGGEKVHIGSMTVEWGRNSERKAEKWAGYLTHGLTS